MAAELDRAGCGVAQVLPVAEPTLSAHTIMNAAAPPEADFPRASSDAGGGVTRSGASTA